ncbi:Stk1 family PASTA domain-containing Ser/Thr kinase [Paenibacillus lutrae]|uniref:Serine/threonine-protein kinase PrkC n=1 Tax=Paenibacillus lutrae TaxID=2078573 RepID=A0A7X3JYM4_9BACL|nr:Stk1 family PASTA domain-containing Ser/Thr kinase [Paenibacillus lutrae]MVO99226.1 Stk1 family PASTA domain-containing Ser/Thr kinase [Paenibacillus lutrae]
MIGTKLGGRYEILERIGGGGMALVYKGLDILLHRKVAVKMLRQQYVNDEEFIRRFRREAQAAASLSHPNVVSIYDVGQEGDVHYIVMEYVEGSTLNELIKERAPLPVEEAVHYGAQISDALEHAHQNEIIHRDIKPHNILIGKNGRVKVTDFGIARAATSSTITQTGSVVGSVHYFSPEHAKGTNTGEKSDLYSLGIVLYQMLTGELPFHGESPISVALKHLQEDIQDPRNLNPTLPQSVENIILKAVRKKPEERYQSARQMTEDLETCLQPNRRNEPKISFYNDIHHDDDENTIVIPAIRPNQSVHVFDDEDDEEESRQEVPKAAASSRTDSLPNKKNSKKAGIWIGILLVIAVLLGAAIYFIQDKAVIAEVPVPDVIGSTVEQAKAKLTAAKLGFEVEEVFDPKAAGTVTDQTPRGDGIKLKEQSQVRLKVSKGPELKKMPALTGLNAEDAKAQLMQGFGLKEEQIKITYDFSDKAEPNTVLEQTPKENEEFDAAAISVKLVASKGKETIKMPNLVGLSKEEAVSRISVSKLKVGAITEEPNYKVAKGKVIKQFPYEADNDVPIGQTIGLIVSSGMPQEAGKMVVNLPLVPAAPGKTSTFKVIVTDAQRDNEQYRAETISQALAVDVTVIVSPEKNAVITVKEDDKIVSVTTKTYQDYLNQQNGSPSPTPSSSATSQQPPGKLVTESGGKDKGDKNKDKDKDKEKEDHDE